MQTSNEVTAGPIALDPKRGTCSVNGRSVNLPPNEFKLLMTFALQPDTVLSNDELIEAIWGGSDAAAPEDLRKLVQRLRRSLGADIDSKALIASIRSRGYCLEVTGARKIGEARDSEETAMRRYIVRTAMTLVRQNGLSRVSIDDISRFATTPKRLVEKYFPSTDELLNEAMQTTTRGTLTAFSETMQDSDEDSRQVEGLLQLLLPFMTAPGGESVGKPTVEWWDWAGRSQVGADGLLETWREWREALAKVIRAAAGADVPEEAIRAMAAFMLVMLNGLTLHAALEGDELDMEEIARLQVYGWDGIFKRMRAEAGAEAGGE